MEIKQKATAISDKIIYWSIIMIPFVASFSSAAVQVFIGFMIFFFILKKILTNDQQKKLKEIWSSGMTKEKKHWKMGEEKE